METFVNFYFWWLAVFMALHALKIGVTDYPVVKAKTIGEDIFGFILIAFFFVWLLFIRLGIVS